MRLVAVIQARMGSSRLPGKVLMPLGPKRVLEHVIERVTAAAVFSSIVVATTEGTEDDVVAEVATTLGAIPVRGSASDVLARFLVAANRSEADAIARITADCPLIDPDVLAAMARKFLLSQEQAEPSDLVTNARVRSFPRGLDAEFFTRSALEASHHNATQSHHREHVTPYLYENPQLFRIVDHVMEPDLSGLRLTLDTPEDYELLSRIFSTESDSPRLRLPKVLEMLRANPGWISLNKHVVQKATKEQ